jgi:uncharacterized RDD family membrane protein YckC
MPPTGKVPVRATIAADLDAPPADPWRRFMSVVYEGVVLFGVMFFFGYAFSTLTRWQGHPGPLRWMFQIYMFGVLGAYFTWFWSQGRRTLPMKTMSLLLQRKDGGPVPHLQAFARYVIASAWIMVAIVLAGEVSIWLAPLMFVPFVWVLIDTDRRALYDIICGTRMAFVPVPGILRPIGPND